MTALISGCASKQSRATGDPLLDVRNPNLTNDARQEAATVAWGEVVAGVRDRERTREVFKSLAWARQADAELRATVVELLMSDESREGESDSLRLAKLMLPSEPIGLVTVEIAAAAVANRWVDLAPALVRSLSRERPIVPTEVRPEAAALKRLYPGVTLERVVFEVFLNPGEDPSGRDASVLRWSDRVREDAWAVLAHLDATRLRRPTLIVAANSRGQNITPESKRLVDDLAACWTELRTLPETAMELAWLRGLRRSGDEATAESNRAWWTQTATAVAALEPVKTQELRLRHLEPIRWAAAHETSWLHADRAELIGVVGERLEGRPVNIRTKEAVTSGRRRERLADWESGLAWADLLAILVADTAIHTDQVQSNIFDHASLDRADRTTEYGGSLEPDPGSGESVFRAILFRPREADRRGDTAFVASDDMIRFSNRALAHYHLHVSMLRAERFAGPSEADVAYCRLSGRTCVVFTSIERDRLGVDLYQPDGVVIDLGEIRDR